MAPAHLSASFSFSMHATVFWLKLCVLLPHVAMDCFVLDCYVACRNDLFTLMQSLEDESDGGVSGSAHTQAALTQPIESYFRDIHVLSEQLHQYVNQCIVPLATENLLENTAGVLRSPSLPRGSRSTPSVFSRGGSLLLLFMLTCAALLMTSSHSEDTCSSNWLP